MASFFQDELHSSDSEDDDYVPDGGEYTSDEDDSSLLGDEIETKGKSKKKNVKVLNGSDEKNKIVEESPLQAKIDEKQRADDLFKNFLLEVETEMKMKEEEMSVESSIADGFSKVTKSESNVEFNQNASEKKLKKPSCELFEFAGEIVKIPMESDAKGASSVPELEKSVNPDINVPKPVDKPPVKRRGIEAVLSIINKKPKLNVLQKTQIDWNQYKKEHGISEDLQNFNKGKQGFIERQRFLQRSDLRSYEIERDMRMSKRKKNC